MMLKFDQIGTTYVALAIFKKKTQALCFHNLFAIL